MLCQTLLSITLPHLVFASSSKACLPEVCFRPGVTGAEDFYGVETPHHTFANAFFATLLTLEM